MMNSQNLSSPENQKVTFVELFFDLVFVFSVTQVVGLLHHDFSWQLVGQAVLVFWLVWWAWTQFTCSLIAANTDHALVQVATLLATAVAFFMAVALPQAFGERSLWLAVTYIVVRAIGLALQYWVGSQNPAMRSAVNRWILVSISGLIVAAGRVTGTLWTESLLIVAALAVIITCALWWTYFPRAKPVLDHGLEIGRGPEKTKIARDAFSLLHFVMLLGIIAYAFAIEEIVAHPAEPLAVESRLSLAIGLLLFVAGMAVAIWRATKIVLAARLILISGTSIIIFALSGVPAVISMGIAFAGILIIAIIEQRTLKLNKVEALEFL